MNDFAYIAQAFADYIAVREGRKPLLIVSEGKSDFAYDTLRKQAMTDGLEHRLVNLVCEDGEMAHHLFVCQYGAPYAREAEDMILDTIGAACYAPEPLSRKQLAKLRGDLQMNLGLLLGYSAAECLDYIESDLGRTCQCDCCGGIETAERLTDGNPSRFVEYAYAY